MCSFSQNIGLFVAPCFYHLTNIISVGKVASKSIKIDQYIGDNVQVKHDIDIKCTMKR